jgi:hypothetical protein
MKNDYISLHLVTSKIFFACILCFLLAGVSTTTKAQNVSVSGANGITDNTTYPNLGAAFTAINAQTNQSGKNIEIKISGNIDEDQNNGSTLNAGTWTTLKIYPTATATITGPSNLSNNKAVISLNGADNVTIDGRINQTGSTVALTLQALSQNSVNVISFTNSAIFNTVKFCTLKGESNNYDCGLINFSTSTGVTGNSNNTIDNCNFTCITDQLRPTYGIYSEGTPNLENTSNIITNNNFYNFGNANRTSSGIQIVSYSNTFTITGNQFYQPVVNPTSSYATYYIYINAGYDYTITNNYMGGTAPFCGGTAPKYAYNTSGDMNFMPIYLNVGKDFPTNVQNNTIQNLDINYMDPVFSAIYVAAGAVNIIGNTIGSSTIAQSIKINSGNQNQAKTTYVIKVVGVNDVYIKNNIIGGIYTSATQYNKPNSLYTIYKGATAGNLTVTGNTIGSETVTNSIYASCATNSGMTQQLVGIYSAGIDINLINENTIANLTNANTYYSNTDINNLAIYTTGGSNTIKDNTIHDINAPMYFVGGIYQASATANSAQIISNNTIYSLYNTSTSQAVRNTGIYNASSGITCLLATNYVYGLKVDSPDTGSYIDGIDLAAGNINCYNNIVNLGQTVTQPSIILGINDYGASGTNNIYHNTVYINGSTSGTPIGTTAFFRGNNTGTGNVRNNIFRNARTGGSNYAAFINTDKTRLTIDYNDYYVDGTNSTFAYLNGTTLTNANILTNLGANSKIDKPLFTNTTPTLATDFRLTTQMAGTNTLLTTVPTDFEGITRTVPTMGAWEKGFVSLAPSRYFTYIFGKGPSTEQMFIIKASGLTADMTITPPTNFEISPVSGGIFTLSPITIKHTNGIINDTIYIRLKAGLAVGPYGPDNIVLASGTISQNVICNGYVIPAVVAGGGGSYCANEPIQLTSSTSGTKTNIFWNGPNNYYSTLDNPTIAAPLTAANAGTYTVTASYLGTQELIRNGGFEEDVIGTKPTTFESDYRYNSPLNPVDGTGKNVAQNLTLWDICYTIIKNPMTPYDVHWTKSNGNIVWAYTKSPAHLGGVQQMVVHGNNQVAWRQQVTLEPYSTYQLSFWILNVTNVVTPAKIYVDGLEISPVYSAPAATGVWQQIIYNLPMANVTTVKLELKNIGGAEFALDDISLKKVYTSSSSVDVSVIVGSQAPNVAITASPGTTVDAGTSITFTATPYNGGINPTYQWNLGTTAIPGATGVTYTYVPTNGDEISCTMTSKSNCKTTATVTSTKLTMTVNAQRNFWKGSIDTNWGDKRNWTATKVPEEGEAVVFSKGTPYGDAQNDLVLDNKERTIGSFTNKVSGLKLIIPVATYLTVNGTIDTDNDPSRILVKAYQDGTQQNGSLIFKNASNVYGSVEMYSKAKMNPNADPNNQDIFVWQYFGIPVETIKPDPTLYGAYVRKSIEKGTDGINDDNDHYLWKEMGNNDDLTAFDGYEICQPNPTTYTFSGKLVNWDKLSGQLACTSTAAYPGQHLFANPYTAAIDIKKLVFGPDMEWSVFLYNTGSYANWQASGGVNTSGEGAGQYISIPQYRAGDSGIPAEVPSMSSMLIKTSPNVSTTDSYLNIIYKDVVKKNEKIQRVKEVDGVTNTDVISTMIDLTGEHHSDRMWIFTDPTCTRNYDNGWDGRKMLGSSLAPQIYAVEPDGDYQVNSVSDMNNTDLAFQPGDEVEYTLKFTHENIQRQYAGVYLVDLVENKTIDVTENGSTYKFATVQSDVPTKRFKILTRYYEKNAPDAASQLKIFSAKNYVFIQNPGTFNGDCTLYNISGQAVRKLSFGPGSITTVSNLRQGAYVISATTNGEKVSKRVIVQ